MFSRTEDYNAIAVELDSEEDRVNVNFESFFYSQVTLYFKELSDYIDAGKEQSARIIPVRDAVFKKIKGLPCQEVPKVLEQVRQEIFNILEGVK